MAIFDESAICRGCGCWINPGQNNNQNTTDQGNVPQYNIPQHIAPAYNDAPSKGFAIIGFLIPLIGLILYLAYNDNKPLKAKSAGKGGLIGFIFWFLLLLCL